MKSITVHGYKLNDYDASYEPKDFIFTEEFIEDSRIIKVKDFDSGMEFWFKVPFEVETPRQKPKRN